MDDDEEIARVWSRFLEGNGFTTDHAGSSKEALGRIVETEFDVIVSDVTMAGMNGIELLREIRRHDLDVPVVL